MYFTIPSIHIPECFEHENNVEIMKVYQNIYNKHKFIKNNDLKIIKIPRADQNTEEFITSSIHILGEPLNMESVKYYADCRSSSSASVPASSYKVLALNKLSTTIPFCVQHQGGNEFFKGLMLLKSLVSADSQCLLTTTQRLQYVTERFVTNLNYLADASSATLFTQKTNLYDSQYQLLEVGCLHSNRFEDNIYNNIKSYLLKQNIEISCIKWLIVNNISSQVKTVLEDTFLQCDILQRNTHSSFNFGSSDIPISLNLLYNKIEKKSLGILLSLNLFNNIDFAIIKKL